MTMAHARRSAGSEASRTLARSWRTGCSGHFRARKLRMSCTWTAGWSFFEGHFPESSREGYTQVFHVMPDEVLQLRHALDMHVGRCPTEVALISMIVLAIARMDRSPSVKFTLVHHGRDHPPGAADVVGFFTDFRTVEVPTPELISVLGIVSYISTAVRERRWRRPEILETIDVLINVVPSPFERVGCFSQEHGLGVPKGASSTWPADGSIWQKQSLKSQRKRVEFQVDQVDALEWSVTSYLDIKAFPYERGHQLREHWLQALRDLCGEPLRSIVLPEEERASVPAATGSHGDAELADPSAHRADVPSLDHDQPWRDSCQCVIS
mmetsp:Transcript_91143/g.292536  ORF Transcript_91143/g.292536 Transcript_91143/m.292536 type:complete len:324 (-) Transcript_91143:185-1156(-)